MSATAGLMHNADYDRIMRRMRQPKARSRRAGRFSANYLLFSVLETIGVALVWTGLMPIAFLLIVHGALVVFLTCMIWPRAVDGTDQSEMVIGVTLFAAFGPAGGIAAIFIEHAARYCPVPEGMLTGWYRSLSAVADSDPAMIVSDEISNGRAGSVSQDIPPDFRTVLKQGQLSNQRWILGKAASNYHSEYRDLLFDALQSPVPAIRVQAAAIVNGLRTQFRSRMNANLDELKLKSDVAEAINPSIAVLDQIGSGLLEEADIDRSIAAIRRTFDPTANVNATPRDVIRLKNHIVWAAGRVPDQSQRQKLMALAVTIGALVSARTKPTRLTYG